MPEEKDKKEKKGPKGFKTVGSFVNDPRKGIMKKASGGMSSGAVQLSSSTFYSPELTPESWMLPKSRQEVIKWEVIKSFNYFLHKPLSECKVGDLVISESGLALKIINREESVYSGKAVRITPHRISIDPLEFTFNHPILAIHCPLYDDNFGKYRRQLTSLHKEGKEIIDQARIIPTEYLKKGDYLVIPRYSRIEPLPDIFGPDFKWSEDVFEMLGWYVAEGFANLKWKGIASKGQLGFGLTFSLAKDEEDVGKWIMRVFTEKFGIDSAKVNRTLGNGNNPRFNIFDKSIAEVFHKEFGSDARNKKIPEWILNAEPEYVAAFLRGWMGGDGHLELTNPKKLEANVVTVSRELADWGFLLFTKLGCLPSFSKRELKPENVTFTGGKHSKTTAPFAYNLAVFGEDVKKIWPNINWQKGGSFTKHLSDSKYLYVPIESIEHFDYSGPAFDILTEDQTYAVPILSYACATHGKITENFGYSDIKNLDIGQKVLNIFGKQTPIVDKISRPYSGKVNDVRVSGFDPITLVEHDAVYGIKIKRPGWVESDCNSFLDSLNNKSKLLDHLSWITTSILEPGDLLAIPRFKEVRDSKIDLADYIIKKSSNWEKYEVKDNEIRISKKNINYTIPRFISVNPELTRFLGRYFASGSADSSIVLFGETKESDLKWLNGLGIPESQIISTPNRTKITSTLISNFLIKEMRVGNTHDKKIPDFLTYSTKESVKSFIDVLFEKRRGRKNDRLALTKEFGYRLFFLATKCDKLLTIKKSDVNGFVFVEEASFNYISDAGFFFVSVEENVSKNFIGDLHHITVDGGALAAPFIVHNCRIFFNLEPVIQSVLTMHSRYPFSKFKLVCDSPEVLAFYEEMIQNQGWDLYDFILRASLSYWVYGEACAFGNWNEEKKKWDRFVLLEPEVVEIHQDLYDEQAQYELIPTEEIRKIVNNPSPENMTRRDKLPEVVIEAVKANKNIPLDPQSVSLIARVTSPSAIRGTPIMQSCLTGDTKIPLLDGSVKTLKELYDLKLKDFWVYSTDINGKLAPGKANEVIYTKTEETLKITLDNGEFFKCSKDHPVLLRNGEYVIAENLKVNDSLMPLYRQLSKKGELNKVLTGYELFYQNDLNLEFDNPKAWDYTHRRVAENQYDITKKLVVHHKNFKKTDNSPSNLLPITRNDHIKLHKELVAKARLDPNFNKKISKGLFEYWASKTQEERSQYFKDLWQNPIYRKAVMEKSINSEYRKEKVREATKRPEVRAKRKAKLLESMNTQSYHDNMSEASLEMWNRPEYREKLLERRRDPEVRKRVSDGLKAYFKNKREEKAKINHKIISIERCEAEPLYDIQSVNEYHNFAISFNDGSGVFVHNCFKILIYQDMIRLAQIRIAERHQLPFELWTLGSLEHKILPTEDDLEKVRNMINEAIQNPPFVLVYPPILNYQSLGVKDKLLNIYEDLGYVENQLFCGLGVNKNLILGEGPAFSNVKTMALHRLVMEYQAIRDMFEKWIYNKVFRRVSEANKFYKWEGDQKKLIIPKIEWEKSLDIEGEETEKKTYVDLHKDGFISTKTLFTKFPNLNFEAERKQLEEEMNTVYDKKDGRRLPKGIGQEPGPVGGSGGPKSSGPGPTPGAPPPPRPGGAPTPPAPSAGGPPAPGGAPGAPPSGPSAPPPSGGAPTV